MGYSDTQTLEFTGPRRRAKPAVAIREGEG